jgi:hypothetical protein
MFWPTAMAMMTTTMTTFEGGKMNYDKLTLSTTDATMTTMSRQP